ncbi:MAG: squalene/phytoene synthase family protein [Elusimicrobiota bacterium]
MTQAPEKSSNFYLGFLFLSKRRREALSAVYAYCRRVDDIVDSGTLSVDEARRELDFWRAEIDRLYAGNPTHAISRRLQPFVGEFDLPREGFVELIAGMELDLEKNRYETFADLKRYLFGAAGTVGLLCVKIFGYRRTPADAIRSYAVEMGNAMQLTNILRDVGADLERGRIYLPLADIRDSGYSLEELTARKHTPAFRRLMALECERVRGFFGAARGLLHPGDRAAMLPAEIMASVYEDVLARIRDEDYRVFFQKVRVPAWRKAALALKAWTASRL